MHFSPPEVIKNLTIVMVGAALWFAGVLGTFRRRDKEENPKP